ncbi:MAG: MFS transporter [Thermodesulfobacteriota bacterium]|nr:MFS transporter [Thermodesulfobacteriota bacterium]
MKKTDTDNMKSVEQSILPEPELERGLRAVIRDGMASQAMVTLTGGPFLVALMLAMGASNLAIGLMAAIPPLAHLVQIPSLLLIEKVRKRRMISVSASVLSRMSWLFIALIPLLFPMEMGLKLIFVAITFNAVFSAVSNSSWNSWMRDLIPEDRLGSFYSRRMMLASMLGIPLSFAAAFYLDQWKISFPNHETYAYSILFSLGFFAGMLGVYFISTIPEPRMLYVPGRPGFFSMMAKPFQDENFKNLLMFMGSWSFAVNLAAPFFTVYMLKRLHLDMSFIIGLSILSQVVNVGFLRIWGRFSDRFSNKSILGVCGPLFIFCFLAWTFTTMPDTYILTLPLLIMIHILIGISIAGVALASGNISLKLAPKGQATAFLVANSVVNSLAAGIAPILGGKFADFFADKELAWTLKWTGPDKDLSIQTLNLQQWDFFFFLAFFVGLYSLHRLTIVKEKGEVEEKIIVRLLFSEVRRKMLDLSTIGGLRQIVNFPFAIMRQFTSL